MAIYLYSNCSTIITGCRLYTDSCLTTPVSNGFYSNGTNYFTVSSGLISSSSVCGSYDYYIADRWSCTGCTAVDTNIIVSFSQGSTVTIGRFYPDADGNYAYKILSTTGSGVAGYILSTSFGSFTAACGFGGACGA
jgi:hypothetical protein